MSLDPISAVMIVSLAASAAWFLARPERADDIRRRLPKSIRGRGTEDPFFPFRRWNWTGLPTHWLSSLLTSIVGALVFGGMALWFSLREKETVLTLILFTAALAAFHFFHAARITRKVLEKKI